MVSERRGVNKNGFENYPGGGWWGNTYIHEINEWNANRQAVENVLDVMQSWGITTVRLPQAIDHWKFNLGGHREIIKDLLSMMSARGITLIYSPFIMRGNDGGYITANYNMPFPPYTSVAGVVESEQDFVDYIQSIAQELKGYSNIVFEVFNEPHPTNWNDYMGVDFDAWKRVWQNCVTAIRATGATQPIVIQWLQGMHIDLDRPIDASDNRGLEWVPYMDIVDPLNNLVISMHVYREYNAVHRSDVRSTSKADFSEALDRGKFPEAAQSYPILIGEIGANIDSDTTNELTAFQNWLEVLNDRSYGFLTWWFSWETQHREIYNDLTPNEAGQIVIDALADEPPPPPGVVSPIVTITVLPTPLAVLTLMVDKAEGYVGDTFNFTGSITQNGSAVVGEEVTLYRNGVSVGSAVSDGVGDYLIPWVADVEGVLSFHTEATAPILSKRIGVGVGVSLTSLTPALLALGVGLFLLVV